MLSDDCKVVIRITNTFLMMGQRKTQSWLFCYIRKNINMQPIPDDSSIFIVEAKLVDPASDFIRTCDTYNKFKEFTDSETFSKMPRPF